LAKNRLLQFIAKPAKATPLKVRVYSDLHNEFSTFMPPPSDADLVILAGDIDLLARGVKWAGEAFKCPVIYVSGNHEYYKGHIDKTLQKMRDAAAPNVHVLENEAFIWKQTRFLGTTGWTDFSSTGNTVIATSLAREGMNDFRMIRAGESYRRLYPNDVVERNRAARAWLTKELEQPFEGRTVVVTHHSPTAAVAGDEHTGHLTAAYTNEWPGLIERAHVWVFGHTHHSVDVDLAGCRVVSNPRGYPSEETGFNPAFEIEI
jgi:predicted phosphodiesterase